MPPELLGPFGALIGAVAVIAWLARAHERSDRDVIAARDRNAAGWEAQTAATQLVAAALTRLSDAIEQRNRDDATRHRSGDR